MAEDEFNLENRVLCADGNCIGLVGADGVCKVCGTPYEGELSASISGAGEGTDSESAASEEQGDDSDNTTETGGEGSAAPVSLIDGEVTERVCCSDDMCVGILGQDGKCGTCGKVNGLQNG